jgi:hypothetical protein
MQSSVTFITCHNGDLPVQSLVTSANSHCHLLEEPQEDAQGHKANRGRLQKRNQCTKHFFV